MENINLNQVNFQNNFYKNEKNIFNKKIIIILNIIIIILIIIIIQLNFKLKKIIKSYENIQKEQFVLKKEIENYKNNENKDLFYKEMLKLYIENRTEFYIRGRQKIMKLKMKNYNDSNINTIQDKLNWLIIHESPELKTNIVDKILLHEYSKKILGKDICVPILKIYNNTEELDLNELPDKFVLKYNHGSGMNILCNNKSNFNITKAKIMLNEWKNINYGIEKFEYQYLNVKKNFFAEKFLCDDIKDYKIYCFNGEPKFIRVQKYLPDKSGKINNYYNLDWTLNDIETNLTSYYRRPEIKFEKPKNLNLMLEYSKKLSQEFAFVRVDLYEIEEIVYLGELTFTPSNVGANHKDRNQSLWLGSLLDITRIQNLSFSK